MTKKIALPIFFMCLCFLCALQFYQRKNLNLAKQVQFDYSVYSKLLDEYFFRCGSYPSTYFGFLFLLKNKNFKCLTKDSPRDTREFLTPRDPWGTLYLYESNGRVYEITSFGADRIEGGTGFYSDIVFGPKNM